MAQRWEERLARRGGAVELLRLPAALFGAAARLRGAAYDRGLLPVAQLSVPVVSVGNVSAGGTGKTPAVLAIARAIERRGARPAVLARGYARERERDDAGDKGTGNGAAGELNDEGRELAAAWPGLLQLQDADRVRGGRRLVELGAQAIVLDDGFQHRRLARDLDLVLLDATRPWGLAGGPGADGVRALLPRGFLREPPSALTRAHALCITRVDQVSELALAELERELGRIAPGLALLHAVHAPRELRAHAAPQLRTKAGGDARLDRAASRPAASLAGSPVRLVSAIGNPAAFERTVRGLGAHVEEHTIFPDHHAYRAQDVAGLRSGTRVVTTAKDAVKLARLDLAFEVLTIEFEIVRGRAVLGALLDALPLGVEARHGSALGWGDDGFG